MKNVCVVLVLFAFAFTVCPKAATAKDPDVFKMGFMTSLSGAFAAVAETQKKGVELAVDQINKKGGLNMPWGKTKIELFTKNDESKLDIGVRRFRELVGNGINAQTGTIWNPMAAALNEEVKISPIPYLAGCVPALDSFKKGNPAPGTYSVAFTPWSIGYLVGGSVIKGLGKKKIFLQSRSDSWGSTILEGLDAACKEYGGEIIGVEEVPKGTADYSAIINKALALKPDIFITAMFGGDAINCLKQAYDSGLYDTCTMFNTWITNVVATGLPPDALKGLYALMYYYYEMEGFEDPVLVEKAKQYTADHMAMWNEPPDAYGAITYVACQVLFQAVEKAGSFKNEDIAKVLSGSHFDTVKGDVFFREDHQMVSDYLAFMVEGKSPEEKKSQWDSFKVQGFFGGDAALPSLQSLGY